jgi:hypothetical protein
MAAITPVHHHQHPIKIRRRNRRRRRGDEFGPSNWKMALIHCDICIGSNTSTSCNSFANRFTILKKKEIAQKNDNQQKHSLQLFLYSLLLYLPTGVLSKKLVGARIIRCRRTARKERNVLLRKKKMDRNEKKELILPS